MGQCKSPIPQFVTNKRVSASENVPDYIQESLGERDIEPIPYKITFIFYRLELCDIKRLQPAPLRKSLEILRNAGGCKTREQLKNMNIGLGTVDNVGSYRKYFTKLTKDVVLNHSEIGKKERMFFFIEDVDKTFNVVALRNSHD